MMQTFTSPTFELDNKKYNHLLKYIYINLMIQKDIIHSNTSLLALSRVLSNGQSLLVVRELGLMLL